VLAKIVDLGRLIVAAEVPVHEAAGLKPGLPVLIGADGAAPRGILTVVGREVDQHTGTYRVQASIPPAGRFAPGQFTEIRIVAEERPNVLVVPEEGLVTRAGEGSWIVVVDSGQATRRPVTVGVRDAGLVEVSGAGLEEGMTVVTVEAYSLPERTKIHLLSR
jgi:membrane fusion protein (multidrug efflux system)